MAEHPTEFTRLNKELATQATDVSLNWFRQIAEQNLKQSCGSLQERAREVLGAGNARRSWPAGSVRRSRAA